MSIEQHQSILSSISSIDSGIGKAAAQVQELTEMCKAGQINKDEYAELILDIQRQININENMGELESLEKLNIAINGLITIAKMA
jgi:polyhydroxyalkanoate synthesis regulator phasin